MVIVECSARRDVAQSSGSFLQGEKFYSHRRVFCEANVAQSSGSFLRGEMLYSHRGVLCEVKCCMSAPQDKARDAIPD